MLLYDLVHLVLAVIMGAVHIQLQQWLDIIFYTLRSFTSNIIIHLAALYCIGDHIRSYHHHQQQHYHHRRRRRHSHGSLCTATALADSRRLPMQ